VERRPVGPLAALVAFCVAQFFVWPAAWGFALSRGWLTH
jgi:hypothetical protein